MIRGVFFQFLKQESNQSTLHLFLIFFFPCLSKTCTPIYKQKDYENQCQKEKHYENEIPPITWNSTLASKNLPQQA